MLKKKEKLEQMRELGRGSLSKGLSFLRNASAGAPAGGMLEAGESADGAGSETTESSGGDPGPASGSAASATEGGAEAATGASGASSGGGGAARLSYEELVALSMKLTRQNKMMKAQFQKMQARMSSLAIKEADCAVLSTFVANVVGIDLVACHALEGKQAATGDGAEQTELPRSVFDAQQLRERFEIQLALWKRDWHEQSESGARSSATVAAGDLLSFSPVATAATAAPLYEEVDLLGGGVNAGANVAVAANGVVVMEQQLEEATKQLERMQGQLRADAAESAALHEKHKALLMQKSEQIDALDREKQELEARITGFEQQEQQSKTWASELEHLQHQQKQWNATQSQLQEEMGEVRGQAKELESALADSRAQLEEKQHACEDQRTQIDTLTVELSKAQADATIAKQNAEEATSSQKPREDIAATADLLREEVESLRASLATLQAANDTLTSQLEELKQTHADAKGKATEDEQGPSDPDEDHAAVAAALREEIAEVRASAASLQAENDSLTSKLEELKQTQADTATAEQKEADDAAAALKEESTELRAALVKLQAENDTLSSNLEELKQAQDAVATAEQEVASGAAAAAALREEVAELRESLAKLGIENEALTLAATSAAEDKSGDTDMSAVLHEELERVKLARAEDGHTIRQLQDQVQKTTEELDEAQRNVEERSALVATLEKDVQHLVAQLATFKQQQDEANEQRGTLEEQVQALTDVKEALAEELTILRRDTQANLATALADAEANKARAEQEATRMKEERDYMTSKLETLIKELDAVSKQKENIQASLSGKEKQVEKMATSQTSMTSEMMDLQQQLAAMREDLAMAAEGLEAHALKAEQSEQQREATAKQLSDLQLEMGLLRDSHQNDFEMLRNEKNTELDRVRTERDTAVAKLERLEQRSKTVENELAGAQKRVAELERSVSQQTYELGNLSVDLAETKKALSDRQALAARLQTENMGIAGKQAEQAALIESALREAAASREQQRELEAAAARARADKHESEKEVVHIRNEMEVLRGEVEKRKLQVDVELEAARGKLDESLAAAKAECAREIERVEAESKHKSKLARQVVLEKETEMGTLRERVRVLEEDVRSGEAANRKIFEFAQLQASREADMRAQAAQLQEALAVVESLRQELDTLRTEKRHQEQELTSLLQTQRREGVNMEYLKNVVVQYMSFRPGSSQQTRLVPVLTTLLQFTPQDIREIKQAAANRRSSWANWGVVGGGSSGISDKELNPMPVPAPTPPRTGSHPSLPSQNGAAAARDERGTASFNMNLSQAAASDPSALLPHASSESADF